MRRSRKKLKIFANTILRLTPYVLVLGGASCFVVSSFKGMITDNLTNDSILKFVNERETDIEIPEEEPTVVFEEETKESVEENVEESTLESTVDYPETVELEKEEHISSELLDSGYEFLNIDFSGLKEVNEDTCAWITIDGTNINYPIVRGDDNEYYLKHNIYGESSSSGTLFVDYRNNSLENSTYDLSDFTIVYGHHMVGGKMLAQICNYKSQSYYDEHPYAVIYTPDGYAYKASFFAGVIIHGNDETAVFTSDFVDADMYDNYIDNIKENSTFESQVPIEYGDKVIALVTCSYETNDSRYVLYAKLEKQLINTIEYGDNRVLNK